MPESLTPEWVPLCRSTDLSNGGLAVPFDVVFAGQTCRAFAIRYQGVPHAYLNRCTHVAMEMDFQPDRFFDDTDTGECAGGPCRGGLVKIELTELDGVVHWHTAYNLKPFEFPI
jgi:nitrite reductase/ring-hydroxylating ferredoxin subunit